MTNRCNKKRCPKYSSFAIGNTRLRSQKRHGTNSGSLVFMHAIFRLISRPEKFLGRKR